MLLRDLTIENIQSYTHQTVKFVAGGILIYGCNGAGKSTIFRSVFGALFPYTGKNQIGTEFQLEDFVRRGAEQGRIKLLFEVGGAEYTVEWEINADGTTEFCTLESEELSDPITGVRDVESVISNELLGMDASSFVSSVYVQQGNIARLVHADQNTRQEILDGLLGLNRVDRLKDRAIKSRREAKQIRNGARDRLAEAQDTLDGFPDREGLLEDIQSLSEQIDDQEAEVEKHEENIRELEDQLDEWRDQLESVEDLQEEKAGLQEDLQDKRDEFEEYGNEIEERQQDKTEAEDERNDLEDAIDELDAKVEDHDLSSAAAAEAALEEVSEMHGEISERKAGLDTGLDNARDEVERLKDEVEDREAVLEDAREARDAVEDTIAEQEARIKDLEVAVEEARDEAVTAEEEVRNRASILPIPGDADLIDLRDDAIPEARDDLADEREEAGNQIGRLQTKLEQLEDLDEEGECPVCGVDHEDGRTADGHTVEEALENTHAEIKDLEGEQERLNGQRKDLATLRDDIGDIIERWEKVEDKEDEVDEAREELDDLEAEFEEQETECKSAETELEEAQDELADAEAEAESLEEELAKMQDRLDDLEVSKKSVETACEYYNRIDDLETRIEQVGGDIKNARKLQRQVQEQTDNLKQDLEEVEEDLEDIDVEEIKAKIEEHEGYLETAEEKRDEAEEKRQDLIQDRSDKQATIRQIEAQEERVETLTAHKDWAEDVLADIEDIIDAYDDVKAEVREQNVELLNAYANDVFDDLYQNQSYAGLQIGQDYSIDLITSDGERTKPEVGSGGEQTVVNLALRAGVYRLVAKRDSSDGRLLPPFILDEPTTALDSDHVDELHSVIQAISEWNVPQVLVVSHNDRLIQNADTALHVEKDPTEDASVVTPVHAAAQSATSSDG